MNPWLVIILLLATLGGGYKWGSDSELASQAREDKIVNRAIDAASQAAGKAIAGIKVTNTTIHQELEREIHKETVYLACRHSADGLRLVNEALSGAQRPGAGQLPTVDATAR